MQIVPNRSAGYAPLTLGPGSLATPSVRTPLPQAPTLAPTRRPAEPDRAEVPSLPDESLASPSMQAALKAAEAARAQLLEQGITPTLSVIDTAKLMALLSD